MATSHTVPSTVKDVDTMADYAGLFHSTGLTISDIYNQFKDKGTGPHVFPTGLHGVEYLGFTSASSTTVPKEGGNRTISWNRAGDTSAEWVGGTPSWISISTGASPDDFTTYNVWSIAANTGSSERTATYRVRHSRTGKTIDYVLTQEGTPAVTLNAISVWYSNYPSSPPQQCACSSSCYYATNKTLYFNKPSLYEATGTVYEDAAGTIPFKSNNTYISKRDGAYKYYSNNTLGPFSFC